MNHIRIQKVITPYGYEEDYWCIDEKILPDYLDERVTESADKYLKDLGTFMGLCPAWSKELDYKGDIRFVWELICRENATILPIILCWEEKLYRRRMNYTLPYYETEGNVCWFQDLNLCFARKEYESMARDFGDRTTLEPLLKLFDRCEENILKKIRNNVCEKDFLK